VAVVHCFSKAARCLKKMTHSKKRKSGLFFVRLRPLWSICVCYKKRQFARKIKKSKGWKLKLSHEVLISIVCQSFLVFWRLFFIGAIFKSGHFGIILAPFFKWAPSLKGALSKRFLSLCAIFFPPVHKLWMFFLTTVLFRIVFFLQCGFFETHR